MFEVGLGLGLLVGMGVSEMAFEMRVLAWEVVWDDQGISVIRKSLEGEGWTMTEVKVRWRRHTNESHNREWTVLSH